MIYPMLHYREDTRIDISDRQSSSIQLLLAISYVSLEGFKALIVRDLLPSSHSRPFQGKEEVVCILVLPLLKEVTEIVNSGRGGGTTISTLTIKHIAEELVFYFVESISHSVKFGPVERHLLQRSSTYLNNPFQHCLGR